MAETETGAPFNPADFEEVLRREGAASRPSAAAFDPSRTGQALSNQQRPAPTLGSTLISPAVGANRAIAQIMGAPVDVATWAINKALPESARIQEPYGGSESFMRLMGTVGADPRRMEPRSETESILQDVGGGVASTVLPAGMATQLPRTAIASFPRALEIAEKIFGPGNTAREFAANIIANATGSAASGVAERATEGSMWQPLVSTAAGLVGGLGGAGATSGTSYLAKEAARYLEPMFESGRRRAVGRGILSDATNPEMVRGALESGREGQFVRGSHPTTGQLTGDIGLQRLEHRLETETGVPDFSVRRAEQNAARVEALRNWNTTGDPAAFSRLVRGELNSVDQAYENATNQAVAEAQRIASELGGNLTPEQYGATMRGALEERRLALKQQRDALYQSIDPNNEINIVTGPARQSIDEFYAKLSPEAVPPSGEEANILDRLRNLPDVHRLNDIIALSDRARDAAKEARSVGNATVAGRISKIQDALSSLIDNAVENQAAHEMQLQSSGQIRPSDTLEARMRRVLGIEQRPQTTNEPLVPNIDEGASERLAAATDVARQYARMFKARENPVAGVVRTTGYAGQHPVLDANVGSRLFVSGPTGFQVAQAFRQAANDSPQALQAMEGYASMSMMRAARNNDGTIDPKKLQTWLDQHQDAMRAFPELRQRFENAAAASRTAAEAAVMQREAMNDRNTGALARLISVEDPSDVQRIVGSVFGAQNSTMRMRELASLARRDPEAMDGLRRAVANHIADRFISNQADAQSARMAEGLQKFLYDNRAALSEVFNREELRSINAIAADQRRAQRVSEAIRMPGTARVSSDLVNMMKEIREHSGLSWLRTLGGRMATNAAIGASAAYQMNVPYMVGASVGALRGAASHLVNSMRDAGLRNIRDLTVEAMLNPALARELVATIPRESLQAPRPAFQSRLVNQLGALSIYGPALQQPDYAAEEAQIRPGRAHGGRIGKNYRAKAQALINAADRAKKQHNGTTKSILDVPDETVAKALSVADQAI